MLKKYKYLWTHRIKRKMTFGEQKKNNEENQRIYKYSLYDRLNIKKSNIFWKIVDLLASRIEGIGKLYEKSVSKEYIRESRIFDISNSNHILHIGCGAYPVTAITLSKNNGCRIVGIDRNLKSVKKAIEIVKRMNLHDKIKIKHGDGSNYPISDFDTIIISSCSTPKKPILENIFENAKKNSKIIVREIHGANRLVHDMIELYDDIVLVKKIENNPFPTAHWESFYLIKK